MALSLWQQARLDVAAVNADPALEHLRQRLARPTPRLAAGIALRGLASAAIDISDGLLADLGHLAVASGVRVELRTDRLQVPQRLVEVGSALGVDPMHWLLTGGEDHALAATFPADAELPEGWTVIGTVAAGDPQVLVDGRPHGEAGGWDHFRR